MYTRNERAFRPNGCLIAILAIFQNGWENDWWTVKTGQLSALFLFNPAIFVFHFYTAFRY